MEPRVITINSIQIPPGKRSVVMLPMPKLYDWTPLSMPVHIINGKQPGPTLCITSAIHGDEVNGIEIVRRLLKKPIFKNLRGTLIAVPIVNIYGFLNQQRYLMDRRDLNRVFPGSKKGSLASRLAYLVIQELLSQSTHCIDLHAGSHHRQNLPQIRTELDSLESTRLAEAFNAPIILNAEVREGSLRQYAKENNIPFLLYEAGESLRFDEFSIRAGIHGILGVMQALEMITPRKTHVKKITPAFAYSSYWIRAPYSGIFLPFKHLGKTVKENELLATIANPTGVEEHKLLSPISGIIIGKNNLPIIHEGAALFHIASLHKPQKVEEHIEYLQESFEDDTESNH